MNKIPDNTLIYRIKHKNCSLSIQELINRHSGICISMFEKFQGKMMELGFLYQDFLQEKDYLIYKTALSFKSRKNVKYSTWLANQVRYFCLNYLKATKEVCYQQDVISIIIENSDKTLHKEEETQRNNINYINFYLSGMIDSRAKEIIDLKYYSFPKLTWKQIGNKMNLSTVTAQKIHQNTLNLLKKKLTTNTTVDII